MGYLLDTDVLSESSKQSPHLRVLRWLEVHDSELHISAISMGEMIKGIHLLPAGKRRDAVGAWFLRLEKWAASRVLPVTTEVMREWGILCARHESTGRRLPVIDSLIVATAIASGLTLVTRNAADYPSEIKLFNPFA